MPEELLLRPYRVAGDVGLVVFAPVPFQVETHVSTEIIPQQTCEKVIRVPAIGLSLLALLTDCLRLVPCLARDEWLVLSGIVMIVTAYLSDVDRVLDDPVDRARRDRSSSTGLPTRRMLDRTAQALFAHRGHHSRVSSGPQELVEDEADDLRLRLVNSQTIGRRDVSEGRQPAVHLPMPFSCPDAVSHPFGDEFTLELGEGEQYVEDHPAHAVRGVKRLRYRDERDVSPIEDLDQANEVGEASCETVDLVDHHHIDLVRFDVLHEAGKRWTL